MSTPPENYDFRIVVAVDLEAGTNRLMATAERYARALNAILFIVHVAAPDPVFVGYIKEPEFTRSTQDEDIRDSQAETLRDEHRQTQNLGAALQAKGIRVEGLTVQGATLETILDETRKLDSDLLILGSHHHSLIHRLWYGETTVDAVKQAPCDLLIVPIAE